MNLSIICFTDLELGDEGKLSDSIFATSSSCGRLLRESIESRCFLTGKKTLEVEAVGLEIAKYSSLCARLAGCQRKRQSC